MSKNDVNTKKKALKQLTKELETMDKCIQDTSKALEKLWDNLKGVKSNNDETTKTAIFFAESLEDAQMAIEQLTHQVKDKTRELMKENK